MRRALVWAAAVALLAIVLWLVFGPSALGYDAAYSLVWGGELRHLHAPDYSAALSPTPHPLSNLVGMVGTRDVLAGLSYLWLGWLGAAAFAVGRHAFGMATGAAFGVLLLTRPLLVGEALDASIDIPFLALVLTALALELRTPRRGVPVLALLGLAGLLRPEAWLLALAYAAYARGGRALWLAALAGPVLWLGFDLLTTGDALHSLTRTQDLAQELGRRRGVGSAFSDIPIDLKSIAGAEVAWLGLAGCLVALLAAERRARLPVALLALGLGGFLVLGVADLPLLTRYLLVPAAMLALFCAALVGAFEWLPAVRWVRFAMGAATLVVLAASVPATRDAVALQRRGIADRWDAHAALLDLASLRAARRCRPVQTNAHRAVPVLAAELGLRPSEVRVVQPARATHGVVFAADLLTLAGDPGIGPGATVRAQELVPPRTFTRAAANRWWTLAVRC